MKTIPIEDVPARGRPRSQLTKDVIALSSGQALVIPCYDHEQALRARSDLISQFRAARKTAEELGDYFISTRVQGTTLYVFKVRK